MMVRTSDIRVSERVCLSSLTLDKFSTVYNDLTDEVSVHKSDTENKSQLVTIIFVL